MTTNFNKLDYILTHFTSNDELRPILSKPNKVGDYVYATNSDVLIKIKADKCAKDYTPENPDKVPDFESVLNDYTAKEPISLNINEVLPCIENIKVKMQGYESECDECSGDGKIECHCCGNESKCEDCDGKGYIKKPGKVMVRDVYFKNETEEIRIIKIGDYCYCPVYLELVMLSMMITNYVTCEYRLKLKENGYHAATFIFGDIEIFLMGVK